MRTMQDMPKSQKLLDEDHGAVIVFIALLLVILIAFSALAIDVGHIMVARNELQNAADAAALAGARYLGKVAYEGKQLPVDLTPYQAGIIAAAKSAAQENVVDGNIIVTVNDSDVSIGTWNGSAKTFSPGLANADAVRAIVRRDSATNGPISTFFAKIIGIDTIPVSSSAIAHLSAMSENQQDEYVLPLGISQVWAQMLPCDPSDPNNKIIIGIETNPTYTSCAGWLTFEPPANTNTVIDIIEGATPSPRILACLGASDPDSCPYLSFLEYLGGQSTPIFRATETEYLANRVVDPSTPTGYAWSVLVPIYMQSGTCANPNQDKPTVGFATIKIYDVKLNPHPEIYAQYACDVVQPGRGGGGDYGTIGSIPGLVR